MPKRPEPLSDPFNRDAFNVADAMDRGVARSRLRASDLDAPFRGVRVPKKAAEGSAPSVGQSVLAEFAKLPSWRSTRDTVRLAAAYRPLMGEGRWFSHSTAAELFGIPLPPGSLSDDSLHVSCSAPTTPPRMKGIVGHRLFSEVRVGEHRGFPVVAPADTWCQLSSVLSPTDLVVAGDYLVRKKRALSSIAELASAIERMGRARGCRNARTALARIRQGTESPRESLLRLLIVDAGLPEPQVGYTINNGDGEFVANPDLAYVGERIAIEYEGEVHRTDPHVYTADILRREAIEEAGWYVIRVVSQHLMRTPALLLARISRALADRATPAVVRY